MAFRPMQNRPTGNKPAKSANSVLIRGAAAVDRSAHEQQEAIRRREEGGSTRQPFRLWLPPDGTEREIVILDEAPEVGLYEHCLMNDKTGRRDLYVPCLKETEECPACRIQASTYVLLLTVIDRTGYEDSKGNWHEWSRKIMAVKPSQQKRFIRQYESQGTLRGAIVTAIRNSQTDASIGAEHYFGEYADDEELLSYINVYEAQGKTVEEDCSQPFDYTQTIKVYTTEEMERLLGLDPLPGSSRYNKNQSTGNAPSARARTPNRASSQDTDNWDNDSPETPQEEPRGRSAGRATPARTQQRQQPSVPQRAAPRTNTQAARPTTVARKPNTAATPSSRAPAARAVRAQDGYEDD